MQLIYISLNTKAYVEQIGKLPDCYIAACMAEKIDKTIAITEIDKFYAIKQYILKSNTNSELGRKYNTSLFKFNLID